MLNQPRVAVFDFDGTLTNATWPQFSRPNEAENTKMCALARELIADGVRVIVLSRQPESQYHHIEAWLDGRRIDAHMIILRPATEPEPNTPHWKIARLESLAERANVILFADDQADVRQMAQARGFSVLDPGGRVLR